MDPVAFGHMNANLMIMLENSQTTKAISLKEASRFVTIEAESVHVRPNMPDVYTKFIPEDCHADDFMTTEAKNLLYKIRRNHKPICFDGLAKAIISQDDQELKYKTLRFNVRKCLDPVKCAPL